MLTLKDAKLYSIYIYEHFDLILSEMKDLLVLQRCVCVCVFFLKMLIKVVKILKLLFGKTS